MRLDDPQIVRSEYATEDGLRARTSVYEGISGPDARDLVLEAIAEVRPHRVLEVGCGWGELAARVADELSAVVVAIDLSPRMVELARERGVDARVGDAEALAFAEGEFDCVTANWMLYHVPDLDRALSELARIVRPGASSRRRTDSTTSVSCGRSSAETARTSRCGSLRRRPSRSSSATSLAWNVATARAR